MLLLIVNTAWASYIGNCAVIGTVVATEAHPQGWVLTVEPAVEPTCGDKGTVRVIYRGEEAPPEGYAVRIRRRKEDDVTGSSVYDRVLEVYPADTVCTLEAELGYSYDSKRWMMWDRETEQPPGCPSTALIEPAAWMLADTPSRARKEGFMGEWVVEQQQVDGRWIRPTAEQLAWPDACRSEFLVQDTYVVPGRRNPFCEGIPLNELHIGWTPELPAAFWAVHTDPGWTVDGVAIPPSSTGDTSCSVMIRLVAVEPSGWATVEYLERSCGGETRVPLIDQGMAPQEGSVYVGRLLSTRYGVAPLRLNARLCGTDRTEVCERPPPTP